MYIYMFKKLKEDLKPSAEATLLIQQTKAVATFQDAEDAYRTANYLLQLAEKRLFELHESRLSVNAIRSLLKVEAPAATAAVAENPAEAGGAVNFFNWLG
jgi:hypothetical protein